MISHALLLPLLAAVAHATTYDVKVGGDTLTFNPSNITAQPGDNVRFVFHPKNHSVTQSTFQNPCSPKPGGFDSGFMPVPPETQSDFPTYTITVNDTQPIWVYCAQKGPPPHCQSGMTFSVNPETTGPQSYAAFQMAAEALGNGTSTTSSEASSYTSPPPPVINTATQTVTLSNTMYTTTFASWEGSSPNPTPAAVPVVHTVVAGGSLGNKYNPPEITASMGDTVMVTFMQKNHTFTESTFNQPCQALSGGFDSGFKPVSDNATSFPTYNITVNDTKPHWFYCRQTGHCIQGMVFAVNPPTTGSNTYDAFLQLAMHSNNTSNASSSSASPTPTSGASGAGRAATSIGLGVGLTGLVVAALL